MRNLLKTIIVLLYVAVLLGACQPSTPAREVASNQAAPTPAAPSSHWVEVAQASLTAANGVGFLNEAVGMWIGRNHTFGATQNGGLAWQEGDKQEGVKRCRFALEVVSPQVMMHCGAAYSEGDSPHPLNTLEVSTDGGKTWAIKPFPIAPNGPAHGMFCMNLSFIDAKTGWAAASYHISLTRDGGDSWTDVSLPPDPSIWQGNPRQNLGDNSILAVSLRTVDSGYLLDRRGNFYATQDGGKSWTTLAPVLQPGEMFPKLINNRASIRFQDADHGQIALVVVTASDAAPRTLWLSTSDGGKTWVREELPVKVARTVYLSQDGAYLTVYNEINSAVVFKSSGLTASK